MDVLGLLGHHHLGGDLLGSHHEAHAHACGQDLGEGGAVDDQPLGVEALDGGDLLTREAKLTVGVVLQDHETVLLADLVDGAALLKGGGDTRGILEGGDDVEELGVGGSLDGLLQGGHVHAVLLDGHAHGVVAAGAEGVQTADEGGILADDGVTLVAEYLGGQLDALITARDDDGGVVEAIAVGYRLTDAPDRLLTLCNGAAERLIAVGGTVLEGGCGVILENISGETGQVGHGEGFGGGVAGGQSDGVGILGRLEDFSDRRWLEGGDLVREGVIHDGVPFVSGWIYNHIL